MLKITCVAVFFGGLFSVLVLVLLPDPPATLDAWRQEAAFISRAFRRVIVPALVGAMVGGMALLASIWRALVRMRWFQVKAAVIAACAPTLHLFMRSRSLALQSAVARADGDLGAVDATLRVQLLIGTIAAILFALVVIGLGRIKPRLGQRYGRDSSGGASCRPSGPGG